MTEWSCARCAGTLLLQPGEEDCCGSSVYKITDWNDCGSGRCDPNTGCPECSDEDRTWVRRS